MRKTSSSPFDILGTWKMALRLFLRTQRRPPMATPGLTTAHRPRKMGLLPSGEGKKQKKLQSANRIRDSDQKLKGRGSKNGGLSPKTSPFAKNLKHRRRGWTYCHDTGEHPGNPRPTPPLLPLFPPAPPRSTTDAMMPVEFPENP